MSARSSSTSTIDTAAQRNEFLPHRSNLSATAANNDEGNLHSKPNSTSTPHHTSLQDYANHLRGVALSPEDTGLTPRHDGRRNEFSWAVPSPSEDQRRNSRNPLPPEQLGAKTPPPLEEIMRRLTEDGAESVRNIRLQHFDSIDSQTITPQLSRSSTMTDAPSHPDTRRSSIAAFAKGLARQIPDMRMFLPPPAVSSLESQKRRDSQDAAAMKDSKKDSKPSFILPSAIKPRALCEDAPKPTPVIEEAPSQLSTSPLTTQGPGKGSLRDRRKVKLDLSLPTVIPDLPSRNRPPAGAFSSITASRPRSPKTPWTRDEPPVWNLGKLPKPTAIMEEGYIQDDVMGEGKQGGGGLQSGNVLPRSPVFERPPLRVRDRCYISRPNLTSRRSDRSGTSESSFARTPDDSWTPNDPKVLQQQQISTNEELKQLGQTTKASRLRRWRWRASSDEALPSPESPNRRFSINPFKRSARISEEAGNKDSRPPMTSPSPSWRGKRPQPAQSNPSSSLAHMALPPTFVPPGVNRVPTPPIFDVQGEVKGKLASFFFDVQGGTAGSSRRKPTSSPGGIWDSDALLMSLSTDINAEDEDEDEGPEGRPSHAHTPLDFETNGTPGLSTGRPSGYLSVHGLSPGLEVPTPVLSQDDWFRIQHEDTPDERAFTALALKEEDERRKFEWLVPEHLPNSPICPLHPKYRGPCKGICYWHGQKRSGGERTNGNQGRSGGDWADDGQQDGDYFEGKGKQRVMESRGWDVRMFDMPMQKVQKKRRRLDSLSSP